MVVAGEGVAGDTGVRQHPTDGGGQTDRLERAPHRQRQPGRPRNRPAHRPSGASSTVTTDVSPSLSEIVAWATARSYGQSPVTNVKRPGRCSMSSEASILARSTFTRHPSASQLGAELAGRCDGATPRRRRCPRRSGCGRRPEVADGRPGCVAHRRATARGTRRTARGRSSSAPAPCRIARSSFSAGTSSAITNARSRSLDGIRLTGFQADGLGSRPSNSSRLSSRIATRSATSNRWSTPGIDLADRPAGLLAGLQHRRPSGV